MNGAGALTLCLQIPDVFLDVRQAIRHMAATMRLLAPLTKLYGVVLVLFDCLRHYRRGTVIHTLLLRNLASVVLRQLGQVDFRIMNFPF